jgi:hypothetical protein
MLYLKCQKVVLRCEWLSVIPQICKWGLFVVKIPPRKSYIFKNLRGQKSSQDEKDIPDFLKSLAAVE